MSHPKRPRDPNQLAKSIIGIATFSSVDSACNGSFASIWRRQSYFRFSPDSRRSSEGSASHAKITAIPRGIGQGQIAVSGTLARTNSLGGATVFPAKISIPDGMSRDSLRLGMSGSATAFSEKAGVIGLLASILVWVSSYTAYL